MTAVPANANATDSLEASFSLWKKTVEAELKGVPFEKKLVTRTFEGIALQPLYTRSDRNGLTDIAAVPGEVPFIRGTRSAGYKNNPWQVAQEIAAATPAEFNAAITADLMNGQDTAVLTPDAATLAGLDPSDAPTGSVGLGGVSLADKTDVQTALARVDLTAIPLHVRAGADARALAALFLSATRQAKTPWEKIVGSFTADPLTAWADAGTLPASLDTLFDSLAGWTGWAAEHAPGLHTVGVDATRWSEAGGTATQELAFALAAAAEYIRALDVRGVEVATAVAKCHFRFAIGPQFFTEVAKFRAFRPLWSRVVSAFGAPATSAALASVHATTGNWNKTLLDPHVNMLRVTTEALSAVLGGVDSLHIAPFDEVKGATDDFSRRAARNVHTLLAEEFSFTQTADPAGGSWYVEKVTDQLARDAWTLFQAIEGRGGLIAALRTGYPQEVVAKAAAEKADAIAKRRLGIVGTNLFPNLRETPLAPTFLGAAALAPERLAALKARRPAAVKPVKGKWSDLFAASLSAAADGASIGQLAQLAGATTTEAAIKPLVIRRGSAGFEELRAASAAYAVKTGAKPKVFLAKIGPVLQHKARADFAAGFFATAGFEPIAKQAFDTAEAAAAAALASGASVAVLCSTDDTYPALVPVFAAAVKAAKPDLTVVLAGLPAEPAVVDAFKQAGVDEFIHVRANVQATLVKLLRKIGALT